MDVGPGSIIRCKSFTDCRGIGEDGKPHVELTFKRSQAKKEKNKYFVMLLLGVDDGNELSPEEILNKMGWEFTGK